MPNYYLKNETKRAKQQRGPFRFQCCGAGAAGGLSSTSSTKSSLRRSAGGSVGRLAPGSRYVDMLNRSTNTL